MMNSGFHSRAIDYFDKVIFEMPNFVEARIKSNSSFYDGKF